MIVEFIDAQRRCGHRVVLICKVLLEFGIRFSERAYRKARTRPPANRDPDDAVVVEALLGTRRPDPVTAGSRRNGSTADGNDPLAAPSGPGRTPLPDRPADAPGSLHGLRRGRQKTTTIGDPKRPAATDLLNRNFTAAVPDQVWIADITYVSTWSGWCYTAFVVDVFSQRILGWAVATSMTDRLIRDALSMAV